MQDRIFGFGSVSVIFNGFGDYSVSAEYLEDFTETEHLDNLQEFMFLNEFLPLEIFSDNSDTGFFCKNANRIPFFIEKGAHNEFLYS